MDPSKNTSLVKVQFHETCNVLQSSSSRIDNSISSLSRIEELIVKKPMEAGKKKIQKVKDGMKEINKLIESSLLSLKTTPVSNNAVIKSAGECISLLSSMSIYVNQHSSPDDLKNQIHQASVEENKAVEVPYKGTVSFNENVEYEEMVPYSGTLDHKEVYPNLNNGLDFDDFDEDGCPRVYNHSRGVYNCSGHQRTFWRCASCQYDWNIYQGSYSRCNKCTYSNASYFQNSGYHVVKTIHCSGSGNCSGFWRCYSCAVNWNYFQPNAFYCINCTVNNQSYYQNPSYMVSQNLGGCNNIEKFMPKKDIKYSGKVKCKGSVKVNTNKEYSGKASYQCPNQHHTCHCQKTAVMASSLLVNLQEIDSLRKENEVYRQLFDKLREKSKDFNEDIKEVSTNMESIYEKVDQTVKIVEKESVVLNNFRDEQKEKISTVFKFKQILDDHEKMLVDQKVEVFGNSLEIKEAEKEALRQEIKKMRENHEQEIKDLKQKYKDIKNKQKEIIKNKENETPKLETEIKTKVLEGQQIETLAMKAISDLFGEFLLTIDSEKYCYYIEEIAKEEKLEKLIKKVDLWMKLEKKKIKK